MTDKVSSWRFVEEYAVDPPVLVQARERAEELGVPAVSAAAGRIISSYAAACGAQAIVEIGTGAGVSSLYLLHGAPSATLTTIDVEIAYQDAARSAFRDAGIPGKQLRVIGKRASDVIDKLADGAYDLVLIDADAEELETYLAHALRLVRPGGVILIPHALGGDRVADPVQRDAATTAYRGLLDIIAESNALIPALSATDDGLLALIRR